MSRIMILRPFFVIVLSVLALLLLWQDVSAQRTEESSQATRQAEATPSTHIPASLSALHGLAVSGGKYAGWITACDDSATIKHDFMAAADSLDPEGKASVIEKFDQGHSGVFDRTKMALDSFLNPGPRSSGGAIDPCTEEHRHGYLEQYEHDLLNAQKLAATERPAAAPTSPKASATSWSLPPLPASHAGSKNSYEKSYRNCLLRQKGFNPNYEKTCQCGANDAVNYLKKNPTHSFRAVSHIMMSGCEG